MGFLKKVGIGGLIGTAGGAGGVTAGAIGGGAYAAGQKAQNIFRRPDETADQALYRQYQSQLLGNAVNFQNQLQPIQNQQLQAIGNQLTDLNNAPSADQQANIEIERRRRAIAAGQEGATQQLNRGIAARGLQNSAAGLFAQSRANQAQANQLSDLESSRLAMQGQFQDQATARRQQLLGQLGGLQSLVQMPGLESPGQRGQSLGVRGLEAFAPLIGGATGAAAGAYFAGPSGAAAGQKTGSALGQSVAPKKNAPSKRQQQPGLDASVYGVPGNGAYA